MTDNARKGTAPCGHPGTFVTPNFITCDRRCGMPNPEPETPSDGVPEHVDPEKTQCLHRSGKSWFSLTGWRCSDCDQLLP